MVQFESNFNTVCQAFDSRPRTIAKHGTCNRNLATTYRAELRRGHNRFHIWDIKEGIDDTEAVADAAFETASATASFFKLLSYFVFADFTLLQSE